MKLVFCVPKESPGIVFRQYMLKTLLIKISFTLLPFDVTTGPHKLLLDRLLTWKNLTSGRTVNKEMIWFPKAKTELGYLRKILTIVYAKQLENEKSGLGTYFEENLVAKELAKSGTISRPGTPIDETVEEYEDETTANQPDVSSFRMGNRFFRLMGWTTRYPGGDNKYVVTDLGIQLTKFQGDFPSKIGKLSENDFVIRSLLDMNYFNVNDNLNMWDTRFRNRLVVNLLRCANEYGYITNHEAVVTAFSLKDERDPKQVVQMIQRLQKLHEGKMTMVEAYKECSIDPFNSSSTNNAYDGPKVLTSLCRQTGLFEEPTSPLYPSKLGDLRPIYEKMFATKSLIKCPRVINVITDMGKILLKKELEKRVIGFEELYS